MGRPVASGLKASSNLQPDPPHTVFAGTPVLLYGELDHDSGDRIELTWDGEHIGLGRANGGCRNWRSGAFAAGFAVDHGLGKPLSERRSRSAAWKAPAKPS